jgi:hypothetical protein
VNPGYTQEPHDRLSRIARAMFEGASEHEEYGEDVKCVIVIADTENIAASTHGYSDDAAVFVALMRAMETIARINGASMQVIPMFDQDAANQ